MTQARLFNRIDDLSQQNDFIAFLKEYFDKNPVQLVKLKHSSQEFIKQNLQNRAFNSFPAFISNDKLAFYARKINSVLNSVSTHQSDLNNIKILDDGNKHLLGNITHELAVQGCKALLKDNKINPDLISMLEWNKFENNLDACELLCSYLGETYLYIFVEANKSNPNVDNYTSVAITQYLTAHFRDWAIDTLKQYGYTYKTKDNSSFNSYDAITCGLIALGIFSGSIALLAAASATRYKSSHDTRQRHDPHHDPHLDERYNYQLYR